MGRLQRSLLELELVRIANCRELVESLILMCKGEEEGRLRAVGSFANMSCADQAREVLVENYDVAEVLEPLVLLRGEGDAHDVLIARAVMALANLKGRTEGLQFVADSHVMRTIVACFECALAFLCGEKRMFGGVIWTVSMVLYPIYQLSIADTNKPTLLEAGVVRPLLKFLTMWRAGQSTANLEWVLLTLQQLAFDEECRAIMAEMIYHPENDPEIETLSLNLLDALDSLGTLDPKSELERTRDTGGSLGLLARNFKEQIDDAIDIAEMLENEKEGKWVMISYNWDVQTQAKEVCLQLQNEGYTVWMDILDGCMGGDTLQAMADAVGKASVVLVFVTRKYKESANCRREASYANDLKKPIVPIIMEDNYQPDASWGWLGLIIAGKMYYNLSNSNPNRAHAMQELLKSPEMVEVPRAHLAFHRGNSIGAIAMTMKRSAQLVRSKSDKQGVDHTPSPHTTTSPHTTSKDALFDVKSSSLETSGRRFPPAISVGAAMLQASTQPGSLPLTPESASGSMSINASRSRTPETQPCSPAHKAHVTNSLLGGRRQSAGNAESLGLHSLASTRRRASLTAIPTGQISGLKFTSHLSAPPTDAECLSSFQTTSYPPRSLSAANRYGGAAAAANRDTIREMRERHERSGSESTEGGGTISAVHSANRSTSVSRRSSLVAPPDEAPSPKYAVSGPTALSGLHERLSQRRNSMTREELRRRRGSVTSEDSLKSPACQEGTEEMWAPMPRVVPSDEADPCEKDADFVEIEEWLKNMHKDMAVYATLFVTQQICNLDMIAELTDKDMEKDIEPHLSTVGHRILLRRGIAELRKHKARAARRNSASDNAALYPPPHSSSVPDFFQHSQQTRRAFLPRSITQGQKFFYPDIPEDGSVCSDRSLLNTPSNSNAKGGVGGLLLASTAGYSSSRNISRDAVGMDRNPRKSCNIM